MLYKKKRKKKSVNKWSKHKKQITKKKKNPWVLLICVCLVGWLRWLVARVCQGVWGLRMQFCLWDPCLRRLNTYLILHCSPGPAPKRFLSKCFFLLLPLLNFAGWIPTYHICAGHDLNFKVYFCNQVEH